MEILMNLVDTETLAQLRSFTIETDYPDPASLQAGLVSKAGEMLGAALAPNALLALQAGNTQAPSAYRYYIEARGYLQRFDKLEYVDQAMSHFQKAIQIDPRYALAYSGTANAWIERFNVTKDPKALDEALASASRAVALRGTLPEVRVTLGRVLVARGQYEQAEAEFQRALKSDPVNADAYRRLARAYEKMHRDRDAEATYRKAVQLRPNDWRSYQSLATYYFNHGNVAGAAQQFQQVLKLTPGNYNAFNDLGAAYLQLGKYPEAAAQLNKSVALKPLAMNYSNIGSLYYYQENYREAAGWYEKAVARESTNSTWWGNLADAYRWAPDLRSKAPDAYGKALSLGRRELSANVRNSRLRSRLAYYHASLGEKDPALREITEALRAAPEDGYVFFQSALVYEQLQNRSAALNAVKAARRAGYPAEAILKAPVLAGLRADPHYSSSP
jgi:serine/threonine-protein kinase